MPQPSLASHSAKVEIHLHVAGHKLNVARIRGGQLELRDKIDLPPMDASVVITVDGQESVTPVVLTKGVSKELDLVEFQ